jgi:predicted aspartyl protease
MRSDRSFPVHQVWSILFIWLSIACCASSAAGSETIHLVRDDQNHLFVPVIIDGIESWWGVDTGFPFSVIDSLTASRVASERLKDANNVPLNADVNGRVCPIVSLPGVTIGSANLGRIDVAELSLEVRPYERSEEIGPSFEMGGILGIDFLLRFNAIIDFQRQEIRISPPDTQPEAPQIQSNYQPIELERASRRRMEVLCKVGDFEYPFSIDTGAAGTSVSIEIAQRNHIALQARSYSNVPVGANATQTKFARINDFQIGNFECGRIDLNFSASKPDMLGRGLLGADLLSKYGAILDIGRNTLYLKKQ